MRPLDRRLFAHSRGAWKFLRLAILCGAIAAMALIGFSILLSVVVARVFLEGASASNVLPLIVAMSGFVVIRAVASGSAEVFLQRSAGALKAALRADLLVHLMALGPTFSRRGRTGDIVNTIVHSIDDIDEYVTSFLPQRFLAAIVPALVTTAVMLIDPLSVLVLLFTGPLLIVFLVLIGSRAKDAADRRLQELSALSSNFLDLLQGLPTLKMFGRSREQVAGVQAVSRDYGGATMALLRTAFETTFVLELSATIATALVAVEIGLRLVHGSIEFQPALAVLILTPEFFLPIRQLSLRYHAGATGQAAAQQIFQILDTPEPLRVAANQPAPVRLAGLAFDGVSFAYAEGRPALQNVSFELAPGSRTALVGATGAGKTTVANLLLRFIEPTSGHIWVDGTPLSEIDEPSWRKQVAWVPQRPYLFYGTVAYNLRLARPDATWQEVAEAAHAAGAHSFIQNLPQGYDTMLGEEGVGLSGGEQQRLAIARAFLKDARYLILDEPTSHLDEGVETSIREALERLAEGRTVLVIAHRLRLAEMVDEILVLDHGCLVDKGAPADVLPRLNAAEGMVSAYSEAA